MSTILGTALNIHPLYEVGNVLSLAAPLIRNKFVLRLAVLSASTSYIASIMLEGETINVEAVTWNLLSLSYNLYMLAGLVCERAALPSFAKDANFCGRSRRLILRSSHGITKSIAHLREELMIKALTNVWTFDRLFF